MSCVAESCIVIVSCGTVALAIRVTLLLCVVSVSVPVQRLRESDLPVSHQYTRACLHSFGHAGRVEW